MTQLRPHPTSATHDRTSYTPHTVAMAQIDTKPSAADRRVMGSRRHLPCTLMMLVGCLATLSAFATMAGRMVTANPLLVEYPKSFAPGELTPPEANCIYADMLVLQGAASVCTVKQAGRTIILNTLARQITSVIMEAPPYSIGELIVAWGEPSGFSRSGDNITVRWSDRSVYLSACKFSPSSMVGHIEFHRAAPHDSTWHGFVGQTVSDPCE